MEIDEHIFIVHGDMLKWIIPFPVCWQTGHGIKYAYSWRNIEKIKLLQNKTSQNLCKAKQNNTKLLKNKRKQNKIKQNFRKTKYLQNKTIFFAELSKTKLV